MPRIAQPHVGGAFVDGQHLFKIVGVARSADTRIALLIQQRHPGDSTRRIDKKLNTRTAASRAGSPGNERMLDNAHVVHFYAEWSDGGIAWCTNREHQSRG